jgi:large subunit ribosomal protein L44
LPELQYFGYLRAITDYLLDRENLAKIATNLGLTDLIKTDEFPVSSQMKAKTLFAVIGALSESSGVIRAHLFVNDFILTQLVGKDINEIWKIQNPYDQLVRELSKKGYKANNIESRLLWSTGKSSPTGAFIVGIYHDKEMLSKGGGETIEIAEEMAARDGLRRLYGTGEETATLPFGDKARKYSQTINSLITTIQKTV